MARERALAVSLVVSVLFHLSACTLFSIVILFPREKVDYHVLEIIDSAAAGHSGAARQGSGVPALRDPLAAVAGDEPAADTALDEPSAVR
ncbi:MAG: hypothetical protein JXR94_08445, partial [Candidatus Hydrogenedentes bacterium]|nr:hypothetical protein [Candidatus Hydrogenedentota bacterium]